MSHVSTQKKKSWVVYFILLTVVSAVAILFGKLDLTGGGEDATATSTGTATASFTVAPSSSMTATLTPSATATAEALLPADFTVKNERDFSTAILPYCYVHPGLNGGVEGVTKFNEELQGLEIYKSLVDRYKRGEISNLGVSVAAVSEGSYCGIMTIFEKVNGRSIETSGLFQSKLDPIKWIEVKFTEPN